MGLIDVCTDPMKAAACAIDLSGMKTDDRVKALFADAKPIEAPHDAAPAPAAVVAPVVPPAPVLLDAVVVESRIESEKALAFQNGAASRQSEVDALASERDALKTSLATAQGNAAQLQAALATEKTARINAEKAHAALMGGVKFTPENDKTWPELLAKHGYAARRMFPEIWRAHMKATVPGWKEHKQENSHG
jgi:hypothetical protein